MIDAVTRNAQARQARVIAADPESLRELAARLETAANAAREGESVICDLAPGLTVIYRPTGVYGGQAVTGMVFEPKGSTAPIITPEPRFLND